MENSFSVFQSSSFMDMNLFQFGLEACEPGHSFGPASRNHYLFHYVLSGCGKMMTDDGRSYNIRTGEGFLITPGCVTTYVADHRLPWTYMWLEFDGMRTKEALAIAGLTKENPVYHARFGTFRETMANEMLHIIRNKDESQYHLIGHLYLFMDSLVRSLAAPSYAGGDKLRDFYVNEAISYIERNFQNNITVEDIASNAGLNRSYFGKLFRDTVGQSPQQFLMQYRMIRAADLLRLTDFSIKDVGNAVGYDDQLRFSRAFKNYHGMSPREWRGRHQRTVRI